jgi:hypothetical protein
VPEFVERTSPQNFVLSDIECVVRGLANGASFLFFVRNGVLGWLEGCTFGGEAWPAEPCLLEGQYLHRDRQFFALLLTAARLRHKIWFVSPDSFRSVLKR